MPRLPQAPSYLKHVGPNGKLYARCKLFGEYISLGAYNSDESLARFEEVRQRWKAAQAAGQTGAVSRTLTVSALAAAWLRHVHDQGLYRRADGTPTSELVSWHLSLAPLLRLHGSEPAASFSPKKLKALRAAMCAGSWLSEEEQAKRLAREIRPCRRTVNQRVARIVRLFAFAVGEELVPVDVHQALDVVEALPATTKAAHDYAEKGPVPAQDIRDTLPCLADVPRAIALLQLATGMRPSEVCGMERAAIDRIGLAVEGQTIWVYRPVQHKTERKGITRAIPLGPAAQLVLTPLLDGAGRWLFAMGTGGPYRVAHYLDQVGKAATRAGVPKWSPGRLRKNTATDLQERLGLDTARATLGHQGSEVTRRHYARGDLTIAAKGAAKLG